MTTAEDLRQQRKQDNLNAQANLKKLRTMRALNPMFSEFYNLGTVGINKEIDKMHGIAKGRARAREFLWTGLNMMFNPKVLYRNQELQKFYMGNAFRRVFGMKPKPLPGDVKGEKGQERPPMFLTGQLISYLYKKAKSGISRLWNRNKQAPGPGKDKPKDKPKEAPKPEKTVDSKNRPFGVPTPTPFNGPSLQIGMCMALMMSMARFNAMRQQQQMSGYTRLR